MAIYQWGEIRGDYSHALIVGNGGSRAISESFSYGSLLAEARAQGLNQPLNDLFERFETDDFELLLRHLWHAQIVNQALDIGSESIRDAYLIIKKSLVNAIRSTHCSYTDAKEKLDFISAFMSKFETVLSLNYDLVIYWAMLKHNENTREHAFKDCFIDGVFSGNWPALRRPIRAQQAVTLVFYPHGALHLATDKDGSEIKLAVPDNGYFLDAIFSEWEENSCSPLIICDGSIEQKAATIRTSAYLSTVLNEILPVSGPTATIYGWNLGDQEDHILHQLGNGRYNKVAVSVHNPSSWEGEGYIARVRRKLAAIGIENITFFDASSTGCWSHPEA